MFSPRQRHARPSLIACLLLACLGTARCGSSSSPDTSQVGDGNQMATPTPTGSSTPGTTSTDSNTVTLQVSIASFAFDTAAATLSPNLLNLAFNDAAKAFAGQGAPYDGNAVPASACQVTGGLLSCSISIANFDVSTLTNGLLLLTSDNRPSATTPIWRQIYTFVPQAAITAARAASGHTLAVRAAAITDTGETAIATWSGAGTAASFLTNGALMGVVQQSDASTAVSGATLTASGYTVTYANDGATAPKTGSTGAEGLLLAVSGGTTAMANTNWTLTAAAGGMTWTLPYTGTVPHALTVTYFVAN